MHSLLVSVGWVFLSTEWVVSRVMPKAPPRTECLRPLGTLSTLVLVAVAPPSGVVQRMDDALLPLAIVPTSRREVGY